ncbi:MAG: hypothetical protein R3C97_13575 [Geminicoccaceae bacterium]
MPVSAGIWKKRPVETNAVPTVYERFIAAIRGEVRADPDFRRGAELQRLLDLAESSAEQGGLTLAV